METTVLKTVPLEHKHIALGAKMVAFAGYNMPVRYSSDLDEHHTVRNAVGIFDVSHMGEFRLTGTGALALLQKVTSNDASKLTPGKAQYSCLPNTEGGIVDDIIVYMLAENDYMIIVNASNIEKDFNWISNYVDSATVKFENHSDRFCLFAIQGPKGLDTLQKLTNVNLAEIPYYEFRYGTVAGVGNVFISNTGYTGAGGFEIMMPNEVAEKVFDAVLEAGKEFGLKPIGLGARDTLRLEMGFSLYGNDIDDTTSPIEAGLGWITKFTKEFNSSEVFANQKENGVTRKLVGFVLQDRGIPRPHYEICDAEGFKIGEVTSGTQSPTLGKGVGMGYVKTEFSKEGSELFINIRGKLHRALVTARPFLKK